MLLPPFSAALASRQRWLACALGALLPLSLGQPQTLGQPHTLGRAGGGIENGGFDEGFLGWTVIPLKGVQGAARVTAVARIEDESPFDPDSGPLAHLFVRLRASGSEAPSLARGGVLLRTKAVVQGSLLTFRADGGTGTTLGGRMHEEVRIEAVVRGVGAAAGLQASLPLARDSYAQEGPCTLVALDGVTPPGRHAIDLAASGFVHGDPVEIELRVLGSAGGLPPCGAAELLLNLYLDDVRFE